MRNLGFLVSCLALFICLAPVANLLAEDSPTNKLAEAYKNTRQYQATVNFTLQQKVGRTTQTQTTDFRIAIDKDAGKAMIDKPDMSVACDGTKLRLMSEQVPGRHLEIDQPKPLEYGALLTAVPFLGRPYLPDLAMVLSPDPIQALKDGNLALQDLAVDEQGRPGVALNGRDGKMVMRLDPKTFLVVAAVLEADSAAMGGAPGNTLTLIYDIQIEKHNQPIDEAAFALDVSKSKAVGSMQELANAAATSSGAPPGGADGQAHPLEGQDAPAINLDSTDGKPFVLADAKEKVIILDFWATWCPPCRRGLPELEKVHAWGVKEKKSLAVYAVNVRETPDQVADFWKDQNLTMTVLMDGDGNVARSYGVSGIPQTVVISGGKVVKIYIGFNEKMHDTLVADVENLLAEKSAE